MEEYNVFNPQGDKHKQTPVTYIHFSIFDSFNLIYSNQNKLNSKPNETKIIPRSQPRKINGPKKLKK